MQFKLFNKFHFAKQNTMKWFIIHCCPIQDFKRKNYLEYFLKFLCIKKDLPNRSSKNNMNASFFLFDQEVWLIIFQALMLIKAKFIINQFIQQKNIEAGALLTLKAEQSSMEKKDPKVISIYASDFLKNFRKNKQSEQNRNLDKMDQENSQKKEIIQQMQRLQMDLEMRSDSQMEAEQLFGNLLPQCPVQQKKSKTQTKVQIKPQKVEIKWTQKKKQKSTDKDNQKRPDKKRPENKKSLKNINISDEQQKVQQTKSILRKGRINQSQFQQKQDDLVQKKALKQKLPQKQIKSVSFQGVLPLNAELQKKWKDPIQNQKKGKFDKDQQRALSEAVGKFLVSNDISLEQFENLLTNNEKSQKFARNQKIFAILSTALPNRSPQSCYKFLKRNFNSLNRKGKWTQDEIDRLKILVQKFGRKWTMISKELKRSADNCYDKFRQLGQENMDQRTKGIWKFKQLVELLKLIEKMSKIKYLDRGIDQELQRQDFHDQKQKEDIESRKYNSKNFIFHNITVLKPFINSKNFQKIDISQIRWNQICTYLKTRNNLDCRNKTVQLLQIFFHSSSGQIDEEIIHFFISKKYQSEHQVNWKEWQSKHSTSEQAKNRYMILKKMVQGRSVKPFKTVVYELQERIQKKSKEMGRLKATKRKVIVEQMSEE